MKKLPKIAITSLILVSSTLACAKKNYAPAANPGVVDNVNQNCQVAFKKAGLCGTITWRVIPTTDDAAAFTFSVWDAATGRFEGALSDSADLNVFLWMPAMGHGSAKVSVQKTSSGWYEITNAYFMMPGTWEIHLQFKQNGQVIDEASVPVKVN